MNNEIMFEYFTYDGEKRLKKGYFIGLKLIENVLKKGFNIKELTYMDSEKIVDIYLK